jgi:hypothetical protein
MDEPLYSSLQDIFAIQDGVVATNQRAAQARIELIERGLIHGFNIIAHLESPNVMNQVEGLPPDALASHGIIKNLLHSALATDVSAVRLTLQGMYVEAFTLIRSAFELTYHAEYFRTRPREALEWDQLGQVIDLKTFAEGIFKIDRKVRRALTKEYGHDFARHYRELCTFGSHTNPRTVYMRTQSGLPRFGNVGFASAGKVEAPVHCAGQVLHGLRHSLSELHDSFSHYLDEHLSLEWGTLANDIDSDARSGPPSGSLFR